MPEDKSDLVQLAPHIDFVAASFVQSAHDIQEVRNFTNKPVIAKVETRHALTNMEEIIMESDGIIFGRGDITMDIGTFKVVIEQKRVLTRCNELGKPVWPATHLMDSMRHKPVPNCAEVCDVSNAVLDGADGILLSAETATGDYPVESTWALANTLQMADAAIDYEQRFAVRKRPSESSITEEVIAASIVQMSFDLRCTLIICVTESGLTAQTIAKLYPRAAILAVTNSPDVERRMSLLRGVYTYNVSLPLDRMLTLPKNVDPDYVRSMNQAQVDSMAKEGIKYARRIGLCEPGNKIIVTRSMPSNVDQYIRILHC
eukprot:GEMP01033836.1.p1 GENE.GEMP01033836.1~~GEMP01033836.1.p1  ORF type:complete len:316 (+),score=47.88 GEMP01033836.1:362-1309(+)